MPNHNIADSTDNKQRRASFWCCWQGNVEDEGTNTAAKGHAAEQVVVRQASSSCESPTPQTADVASDTTLEASSVWYDCNEDFGLEGDAVVQDSGDAVVTAGGLLQQAYAALPQQLTTIVKQYKQGDWIGCKPTLAVIKYMESTATSLQQLQQQLAQVLAAEQASSSSSCSAAPTSPACKSSSGPAQPTCSTPKPDAAAAVMHIGSSPQQQQKAVHQHQQGCKESGPSIARLLYNVELVHRTLAGMDDLEGFQQVAHGKLELWYKHDTVNQQQLLKARTVLDEPVVHGVCLAREVDLVPGWNPAILDARELKAYSTSELLVYLLNWCPWPLPCPEVLNYALGVDLLDTSAGCVLLATNTPTESQLEGITTPEHPRTIRMTMHAGGFRFVPLPPDPSRPHVPRTEATVLLSFDAKKFVLPDAAISFILKIIAPLIYKSVHKVLDMMFHGKADRPSGGDGKSEAGQHTELLDRLGKRPEYAAVHKHCCKYVEGLKN